MYESNFSLQLCQHYVLLNFLFDPFFCFHRGQQNWLQLDHRVLDHDLPKKPGPAILYFAVRYVMDASRIPLLFSFFFFF
jgi:hypothetical protein